MDCKWVKSFWGVQVWSPKLQHPGCFTLPVTLNRVEVEVLFDTRCGRTLVKKTKMVRMQCIYGDIQEYRMKMVTIGIGSKTFTCRVWVVPQLDYGVLIEWDNPILT